MKMAKSAGVKAIGVAWGYHTVFDLNEAGADVIIESFAELDAAIDEVLGTADA
jgi:phosphoglycolate phosphatase